MRIGANLAGMQQNLGTSSSFHIPPRLATRDSYTDMLPGHPTFPFRQSTGITLGTSSYEHLIAVNQVGKRFYNEMDLPKRYGSPVWPGGPRAGSPNHSLKQVQGDWRNSHPGWVKQMYNNYPVLDAAMAMNEGSQPPHYYSGPLWAIFDRGRIERDGWDISPPFTADNGYFFSADTIEELARKIHKGHEFQRVPLANLTETLRKWNSFVDAGADPDFGRGKDAPMHKIDKPPFYAASICPVWHDSYGGLRINGKAQVVDMQGMIIPGLYCGGEASGGGQQHGLGRELSLFDQKGLRAGTVKLGHDVCTGTEALYVAEVEVSAPLEAGSHPWQAKIAGWEAELPHTAGSFPLMVRVVPTPDCEVTVKAVDREKQMPIAGACVVMHPYRTVTNDSGIAVIRVARGQYDIRVSGSRYQPVCVSVEVTANMMTSAELDADQPWTPPDEDLT